MLPISMQDLFDDYAPSRNTWANHCNRNNKPAFNIKIHKLPYDLQDYWFKLSAEDVDGFELRFIFLNAAEDAFGEFLDKYYAFPRILELIRTDGRSGGWLVLNDPYALSANECYVWDYEEYIRGYVRDIQQFVQPRLKKHRHCTISMRYSAKVRAAYQKALDNREFSWPTPRMRNGKKQHWPYPYSDYIADVIGTYEYFWDDDLGAFRDKYQLLLDWQAACERFVESYAFYLQDHKDQQLEEKTEHASNPDL